MCYLLIMYYIIIRVHRTSQGRRREGSMIPSPSKSQLRGFINHSDSSIHTAVQKPEQEHLLLAISILVYVHEM